MYKTSRIIKGNYLVLGISGLVLLLWLSYGILIPFYFGSNFEKGGQFGDGFGAINSLFTGLGIVGLVYTINLQIQMYESQKKQDLFLLHIKLIDDLKSDFEKIELNINRGSAFVNLLTEEIRNNFANVQI